MVMQIVLYIAVAGLLVLNVMLWTAVEALTAEVALHEDCLVWLSDVQRRDKPKEVELPGEPFDWGQK